MNMTLSTFIALRNPLLSFLNFLNSRALLSYKPLSCKKNRAFAFKRTPAVALQAFDAEEWHLSSTDYPKSYENSDYQDFLRPTKNGSLENQKSKLFKTVGSDKSLYSEVSGN